MLLERKHQHMCIYCGTQYYRKIYKEHHGPIPKDEYGRTYEIHHVDNNHYNNDPSNLKAVSIQEHHDIHYSQGDYSACLFIAQYRLRYTPEELSELARKNANKRISEGNHHWLGGNMQRRTQRQLVTDGKHHLLSGDIQRKTNAKRLKDGSHHCLKTGADAPRYDSTVFTLENVKTGETVSGTRQQLIKGGLGFNDGSLYRLLSGRRKTNYGWRLKPDN